MNCRKVLFRLHAYLDEEMTAKLMREMDEHLGACPSCRSQVEHIRQLGDILDSLTVPPLPNEFAARVMAEARRKAPLVTEKKSFFPLEWQPLRWLLDLSVPMQLAACAMVFLACLLGMFMSNELSLSGNLQATFTETGDRQQPLQLWPRDLPRSGDSAECGTGDRANECAVSRPAVACGRGPCQIPRGRLARVEQRRKLI